MVPIILSLVYLVFGSLSQFSWLDDVLIFLIEHYLSNILPLFFGVIYLFSWHWVQDSEEAVFTVESNSYHTLVALLQFGFHLFYWNQTMLTSVNAIRYLDPSWSKVEEGDRLLPSAAYFLGLAEYAERLSTSELNQKRKRLLDATSLMVQEMLSSLMVDV